MQLHFAIYRATGLPTLVGIIEGLWLKIGPVLNLDLKTSHERLLERNTLEQFKRTLQEAMG